MAKKKPAKSVFDKAKEAHKVKVKEGKAAQKAQRKKNPGGAPQDKVKAKPKAPKAPKAIKAALGKRAIDAVGGSLGRAVKRHPIVAAGAALVGVGRYLTKDVKPKKTDEKGRAFSFGGADDYVKASTKDPRNAPNPNVKTPSEYKKMKATVAPPLGGPGGDVKPANKNNFKEQSSGSVIPPRNTKKMKAKVAPPLGGPGGDVKIKDGSAAKPRLKQGANQTLSGKEVAGGERPKKVESNLPSPKAEGKPTTTPVPELAPKGANQAKPHLNKPSALKRALASSGDGPSPKELTTKQVTSSVRGDVDYKAKPVNKVEATRGGIKKPDTTKAAKVPTTKAAEPYGGARAIPKSTDKKSLAKPTVKDRYTSEGLFKAGEFGVFGGGGIKTANDKKNLEKRRQREQNNAA